MSESLDNCCRSRQMTKMRHWWNKIFFAIIRVMIVLNQIILMAPFIYFRNSKTSPSSSASNGFRMTKVVKWKFRTHRLVTAMAIFLCLSISLAAPVLVIISSDLYNSSREDQDNLFSIIAKFILSIDMLFSILIMVSLIWYRENVVRILNLFNELIAKFEYFETDLVGFIILTALLVKIGSTVYKLVLSLPFLIRAASQLATQSIVAYMFTHYVEEISSLFSLNIFAMILILLALSFQLEKQLNAAANLCNDLKMSQLISLQNTLQHLIALCVTTFQFGIFLIILLDFVTILCNIYAMLDYYVTNHKLFHTFIAYILSVAVELYSLILVCYLCERSQRKVKDLFLLREESYFLKLPLTDSLVEWDVLWPQLQEFNILGLFHLSNDLALFLLAYSINFIMIILEFEANKARK